MEKKDKQILARFLKQNASYRKFRRSENGIKFEPRIIKTSLPSCNFIYAFFISASIFSSSFWYSLDKKWGRICGEVIEKRKTYLSIRINKYDACSELDYKKYDKLYNGT